MDPADLARAARRRLRSTEAGALEAPASGVAGRRAAFVLTHEGRPLVAATAGLRAGAPARLFIETPGAEPTRVAVEGTLRAASPAEAARFAAFVPAGGEVLCLEPEAVRVEGGAGASLLTASAFLLPEPAWKSGEADVLRHMNEDHEDAMLRMSRHFHGVEARRAELVAVDPEGLHVRTDRGVLYFAFDRRCETHDDVHHATVRLARTARLALAGEGAA